MSTQALERPSAQPAGHWTAAAGEPLLLRVNPVPGRRLGTAELAAALAALAAASQRKLRLSGAACDELYLLAGQLSGKDRHVVLNLRRAIYNDRDPVPWPAGADWPEAVTAWLAEHELARQASEAVRGGYGTLLAAERAALAQAAASEPFQLALALNAPQALDAVQRYLACGPAIGARERKSERGIVQYLTRAMVRTSPLSWFTAVGFALWAADGAALDAPAAGLAQARSFVTVDRVLLGAAVTGMTGPPAGQLPDLLARNPTLRPVAGRARFQRRTGESVHLVQTPLTRQLRTLLQLTAMGPLPAAVLTTHLAGRLAVDRAVAGEIVRAAVAAAILMPGPVLTEQAYDLLPQARDMLGPEHQATCLIAAAQRELGEVAAGEVGRRQSALGRIAVIDAQLSGLTSRPARLHVNEDVLLPTSAVTDHGYQAALHDLAGVAELASVFDPYHVMRCLLSTAFTERFGPGGAVNLVEHAEELALDVAQRSRVLAPGPAGPVIAGQAGRAGRVSQASQALAGLLAARQAARAALTALVKSGLGEDEVWLPAATLAELADGLPYWLRRRPASSALLVQPAAGRLVVNGCYGGRGLLGMRFLGPAGEEVTDLVAGRVSRLLGTDGTMLVEDYGMHGSNLNHRPRLLADELDPAGWLGIRLIHDPDDDLLTLALADGTPVRVVYSGMRWIEALPLPLRIAAWLTDSGHVRIDPVSWVRRSAGQARHDAGTQTASYPRVVAGAVVLARRRWYPGEDFASHVAEADEVSRLLALTRWRARHGVPEQVLIKSEPEPMSQADPASAVAWYQRARRRGKPQYLDLASALMVRVMPRLLERREAGYLEEALPAMRDGGHAFEWAIEYDRPPGGRFQSGRPARWASSASSREDR